MSVKGHMKGYAFSGAVFQFLVLFVIVLSGCSATSPGTKGNPQEPDTQKPDEEPGSIDLLKLSIYSVQPNTGLEEGGEIVTIRGEQFVGDIGVKFGENAATEVSVRDKNTLQARVPAGQGMVTVTVSDSTGKQASLQSGYTYRKKMEWGVDWCRLNTSYLSARPGQDSDYFYGEVYEENCTQGRGGCESLKGQVGWVSVSGDKSDLESYTWVDAHLNDKFGGDESNSEYMAKLKLNEGEYRVAFRFSMDGTNWQYCDMDGSQNGFNSEATAQLLVAESVRVVDWCIIHHPKSMESKLEDGIAKSEAVYGRVHVADCTHNGAKCEGLKAQLGIGPSDVTGIQLESGFTWKDVEQNAGHTGDDNAEYMGELSVNGEGRFSYLYRFSLNDGKSWRYCDTEDHVDFDIEKRGVWTVKTDVPKELKVSWCTIQSPHSTEVKPGLDSEMIYGRAYVEGCTEGEKKCESLKGQLGYGAKGSDASKSSDAYQWVDASYNEGHASDANDEHMAVLKIAEEGEYAFVYRFSVDDGKTWLYCDIDGHSVDDSGSSYSQDKAGSIKVGANVGPVKAVTWCKLQSPDHLNVKVNDVSKIYGHVHVPDCTAKGKKCEGVIGEFGYGPVGVDASQSPLQYQWLKAEYYEQSTTVGDKNNEYEAHFKATVAGSFSYAYRFSLDGKRWLYCDLDGSELSGENRFSVDKMGVMEVKDPSVSVVDWCELRHPLSLEVLKGTDSEPIFGRVNVSNCSEGEKKCEKVKAELGYGLKGINPEKEASKWKWFVAHYNASHTGDNNDEYGVSLNVEDLGSYSYVYRFSLDDGKSWRYCDSDGSTNGFSVDKMGSLTVKKADVPVIGWCNLQSPSHLEVEKGKTSESIYGRVFVNGCTEGNKKCVQVKAELGYGDVTKDPVLKPSDWQWVSASYNALHIGDNNDEYEAKLTLSKAGEYGYAYRFSLDNGKTWRYCDLNGSDDGFNLAGVGELSVKEKEAPKVSWCRTQHPPRVEVSKGVDSEPIYGQVLVVGCTEGTKECGSVKAELGYGKVGTDPKNSGGWVWKSANINSSHNSDDNDEYSASLNVHKVGNYVYAYRFSTDGKEWTYCDLNGSQDDFSLEQMGTLVVKEEQSASGIPVSWCNIQHPKKAEIKEDESLEVYGWVYKNGCTDQGQCKSIRAQVGYAPRNPMPDDTSVFKWVEASYHVSTVDIGDNNEFKGILSGLSAGEYLYVYRFSDDGGKTWKNCDTRKNGSDYGFVMADAGQLKVKADRSKGEIVRCMADPDEYYLNRESGIDVKIGGKVEVRNCKKKSSSGFCEDIEVKLEHRKLGTEVFNVGPVYLSSLSAKSEGDVTSNVYLTSAKGTDVGSLRNLKVGDRHEYRLLARVKGSEKWQACGKVWTDVNTNVDNGGYAVFKVVDQNRTISEGFIQHPKASITVRKGEQVGFYGRVKVNGCTNGSKHCEGILSYISYKKKDDAESKRTFAQSFYNVGHVDSDYDEYMSFLVFKNPGKYVFHFRFSGDGGSHFVDAMKDGLGAGGEVEVVVE